MLAASLLCTTSQIVEQRSPQQPHVVFTLVDDWGYNDVGWRSTDLSTPNIDSLAESGIKLMSYYTQPICTPARTSLMTGRYPIRAGMQHAVIGTPDEPWGLPTNESTLADGMKALGYKTVLVGKWHLGLYQNEMLPTSRGFDQQFGYLSGEEDHYTHAVSPIGGPSATPDCGPSAYGSTCLTDLQASGQLVASQNGSYSAFVYAAAAEAVVLQHNASSAPLFLYYALQDVHAPLEAPDEWVAKCPEERFPNADRRTFCAMTLLADSAIGNLTRALRQARMLQDTIMVIAGDNGGMPSAAGNNWPLRGTKGELWEGGVRNSALVYAPSLVGRTRMAGKEYHGLVHISDWQVQCGSNPRVLLPLPRCRGMFG
jgi:arylsulfatase A-like enzyme